VEFVVFFLRVIMKLLEGKIIFSVTSVQSQASVEIIMRESGPVEVE
jgi:hypothetical protein